MQLAEEVPYITRGRDGNPSISNHALSYIFGPLSYMRRVVICQFHEGTGDYILYLCAKVKNNNRTGRAGSRNDTALSPAQSSARGARSDLGTEDGNVKRERPEAG